MTVTVYFVNGQHAVVREAVSVTEGRFVAPTITQAILPAVILQDREGEEVGRFNAQAIVGYVIEPAPGTAAPPAGASSVPSAAGKRVTAEGGTARLAPTGSGGGGGAADDPAD